MSDSLASLLRKINSAGDLQSVVRTMKALAASSVGQYEQSVRALTDYYRTVELGLGVCFRLNEPEGMRPEPKGQSTGNMIGAIVFGSDQGLVGQFNEVVADYALKTLATFPCKPQVWAVGERVYTRLADTDLTLAGLFAVPNSVQAITPLVGQILVECETRHNASTELRTGSTEVTELHLFYNRRTSGAIYEPVTQRLLPLDDEWQRQLAEPSWPNGNLPELMGDPPCDVARADQRISFRLAVSCLRRIPG
ncbi:MAG: F0F1 ATP synthase subunit gamma [Sulfuritalea sp.]|nr:F0F1 ATP synthase subunit gamma [Sulfuritalea sp.]